MIIGIPKEIKNNESRVSITPGGVFELNSIGHKIFIQKDAGKGSGYLNKEYKEAGAIVLDDIEDIYNKSEMIVKVKEPIDKEYSYFKKNQIIFTYLHLSSNKNLAKALMKSSSIAVSYETIEKDKSYPLLAPMSEVAGRQAAIIGAFYLSSQFGGRGLFIGGISGVTRGRALILGAGIVAKSAAKMLSGIGANVVIMSPFINELREIELSRFFDSNVSTRIMSKYTILEEIKKTDLLISCVYVKGSKTPILVTKEMVDQMKMGSVIVAVDIDQGSCVETARPTNHQNPIFIRKGVVHYCVSNIPGVLPRTSTIALTSLTLPYIKKIAENGINVVLKDEEILTGLNIYKGNIVYKKIAVDLNMTKKYKKLSSVSI